MDIEQEYTQIIDEYDVFECYPQLKKWEQAEKLIVNWIREHLIYQSVLCVGTDATDLVNIKHLVELEKVYYQYVLCENANIESLESFSCEKIDCVLIISLHSASQIRHYLRERGFYVELIYDYFAMNGLFFEDEYYRLSTEDIPSSSDIAASVIFPGQEGWRNNIIAEFLNQKDNYENEKELSRKKLFLERQLVLAIYMKNFVLAENIIYKAEKEQIRIETKYLRAWDRISQLIDIIKGELQKRNQEDIVVIWMDALGYGDGADMPYLQSQIKDGVKFTNAFTVTPYTNPTLRVIINEKKDIDDFGYKDTRIGRESKLISYLLKKGYRVKIISGYFKGCDEEILSRTRQGVYSPCSEILWNVWKQLLSDPEKVFLIGHLLTETHVPNWSTKMERGKINDGYRNGRLEIDEQMQFYLSDLNKNAIKIYMSDHGHSQDFHVYLVVNTGNVKPAKVNGMFSLIDFHKLIEQLIEEKDIHGEELVREYVEVQNMDHYNPKVIKGIISNKKMLERGLFGYRGVVDKQYVYVHYNTGKEWLVKRDEMVYEPHLQPEADDVCDKSLLPYYRKLAGENPPNFYDDKKFKYSKYIYALYNNFVKQKNPCFALLNQLVEPYEDNSIAIRLGGPSSVEVYFWLTERNRRKIYGIIDNYSKCVCSKIKNMRILSLEEAFEHKEIKVVLIASYKHWDLLKKESEQYPSTIKVLDAYDYFEKNGCNIKHHFSDPYMGDEGYDVGFPMDE